MSKPNDLSLCICVCVCVCVCVHGALLYELLKILPIQSLQEILIRKFRHSQSEFWTWEFLCTLLTKHCRHRSFFLCHYVLCKLLFTSTHKITRRFSSSIAAAVFFLDTFTSRPTDCKLMNIAQYSINVKSHLTDTTYFATFQYWF